MTRLRYLLNTSSWKWIANYLETPHGHQARPFLGGILHHVDEGVGEHLLQTGYEGAVVDLDVHVEGLAYEPSRRGLQNVARCQLHVEDLRHDAGDRELHVRAQRLHSFKSDEGV